MTATQILEKLVSFSVFGGESNLSIIHWIQDYVERHGIETHLVLNEDNTKASLHCRIGPAVDGGMIFSGHTDVVPVEGQAWDTHPFVLTDGGDGKLYGRGSCDMKGFIACCLAALPTMMDAQLAAPFYFAFSYDEEIGCLAAPDLILDIKKTYSEKPTYALIGEPSLMQPIVGQKGICVIELHLNGSAGHSSRIKQEVSAVHEAARLILWIEGRMDALIQAHRVDERFHPPHTSLHIGQIQGGIAHNVIADKASFSVDIRTIPMDKAHDLIKEIEHQCRKREQELRPIFSDFTIQIQIHHPPVPPLDTDQRADIIHILSQATGISQTDTVAYAAEAGQYHEGGYESIICGPGSIEQAHRENEFIEIDQLHRGVQMIENLIDHFSASG